MRWSRSLFLILGILLLGAMLQSCSGDSESGKAKEEIGQGQETTPAQDAKTPATPDQTEVPAQTPTTIDKGSGEQGKVETGEEKSEAGQATASTNKGPVQKEHPATPVGKLVLVRGMVILQRNGSKQTLRSAVGDSVYLNDRIITSKDGYARMHMRDDSILRIAPSSELAVTTQLLGPENSNTTINLLKGKLRAIVVHKLGAGDSFEVQTDIAVAGVRGTDFEVIAGDTTEVRCFKGVVAITNTDTKITGSVLLTPQTYTKVALQSAPVKPQPLPPQVIPLQDPKPLPRPSPVPAETTGDLPPTVATPESIMPMPVPGQDDEEEAVEEPAPEPVVEPAMTQEQLDALVEQGYEETQKSLQQGKLLELWEQDPEKAVEEALYGDGLDGWTIHPAK